MDGKYGVEVPLATFNSAHAQPVHGITYQFSGSTLEWVVDGLVAGQWVTVLGPAQRGHPAFVVELGTRLCLPVLHAAQHVPEPIHDRANVLLSDFLAKGGA